MLLERGVGLGGFAKDVGLLAIKKAANNDITVAMKLSDLLVGKYFLWHGLISVVDDFMAMKSVFQTASIGPRSQNATLLRTGAGVVAESESPTHFRKRQASHAHHQQQQ